MMQSMFELRLKTGFWVDAFIRKINGRGFFCTLVHKGYEEAGTVLIKVLKSKQKAILYNQSRDLDGKLYWENPLGKNDEMTNEKEIETYIKDSLSFDSDIWIVEVEDINNKFQFPEDMDL